MILRFFRPSLMRLLKLCVNSYILDGNVRLNVKIWGKFSLVTLNKDDLSRRFLLSRNIDGLDVSSR